MLKILFLILIGYYFHFLLDSVDGQDSLIPENADEVSRFDESTLKPAVQKSSNAETLSGSGGAAVLSNGAHTTPRTTTSVKPTPAPLHPMFKKLDWLVGTWRGEFSGKVFWPTIPTMNYGEELIIEQAPVAKSSGVRFLNFSARAWSHTTKDQLHDEWGFMTINDQSNVTLMTSGNNGFTTYEEGWVEGQQLILRLKKIGRISFSRDLPVEDLERRFKRLDQSYMEQALRMRTATHPRTGLLDHTIIIYEKKA